MLHPLLHLTACRDELLQASQSITALQDEKNRLLQEAEEAEEEARQWQRMAVVLLQRLAAGGAATRTRTACPARRITSLQPSFALEVPDEVQEELSARMLSTRILRQELAFSQPRLQQEEAEVEQLVADLDDLRMKELSAEATVQHREWHSATVQSVRQSIAKQAQAIAMYEDRARGAELHVDRLREEILQLRLLMVVILVVAAVGDMEEEAKAATEECQTMSRRIILENDRQSELHSVTLALCEELASSNHEAESVLEEQLRSPHLAHRRAEYERTATGGVARGISMFLLAHKHFASQNSFDDDGTERYRMDHLTEEQTFNQVTMEWDGYSWTTSPSTEVSMSIADVLGSHVMQTKLLEAALSTSSKMGDLRASLTAANDELSASATMESGFAVDPASVLLVDRALQSVLNAGRTPANRRQRLKASHFF
eukprot:s1385_g13.t4